MSKLSENIKNRRIELGLTQDDLARMLGYSGKSTISKIEKGEVDLQQTKIEAFAKALYTDPKSLAGWSSDSLTSNERALLDIFCQMTEEGQAIVLNVVKGIAPQYKK